MRHVVNLVLAAAVTVLICAPVPAAAQPDPPPTAPALGAPASAPQPDEHGQPGDAPAAAHVAGDAHASGDAHGEGGEHGNPVVDTIARLFNFGILVGVLVYFLKSPIAGYLRNRGIGIRSGLANAAELRRAAAADLTAIEARMAMLPAELEAIRKAGASEAETEEARIREAAAAERVRLLEQARREIDWHLKVARRDLRAHAADLAVAVAAQRVKASMTAEDQARLVDRYLGQLGRVEGPAPAVRT